MMSIKYSFKVQRDLLRVTASGKDDNLEEVQAYGMAIIEAALTSKCKKVLCDERSLEYSLGIMDTFQCAKFMSENAPTVGKAALVYDLKQINDIKFWETVAVNRGVTIKIFNNIKEAERWLKE
jgi:hypothetical protein